VYVNDDSSHEKDDERLLTYTVYTDAVHIADGVVGLKQRSLAASDPTA